MNKHNMGKFCRFAALAGSVLFGAGCAVDSAAVEDVGVAEAAVSANGWENWLALPTNANGFEGSPGASLGTIGGAMVVGRDLSTNRFRVSTMHSGPWTSWTDFGTKTFIAKPAVAPLDGLYGSPEPFWSYQVAVVGIASDNQYYIRIGKFDTTAPYNTNPTLSPGHDWTLIPNSTYASPPAATVHWGTLVVAGRKSNNTLVLHQSVLSVTNPADFYTNVWSATTNVPALPAGWVAQGDPAIASTADADSKIIIITRAVNNGQKRLYANTWDRTSFFGWVSIPLTGVDMSGEPAVEFGTALNKATVYIKGSDSKIYQSSGLGSTWANFAAIRTNTFTSNPAAAGNFGFSGHHLAVARNSNNQFLASYSVQGEP